MGDLDIENFPTVLIQKDEIVAFYGTMMPEPRLVARIMEAQIGRPIEELRREAASTPERQIWQQECNLIARLAELR